jgi:hypothetical protein
MIPLGQFLAPNAEGSKMWIETIVMPREDSKPYRPSRRPDRRAVYNAGCAESLQFRTAVLNFLENHQLMNAVKWVSEPGSLPMVRLHCRQPVLDRLQKVPEFEAGRSLGIEHIS